MDEQATTAMRPRDDEPLRRQVLRILEQHPAGLTPGEIASQLGLTTSLTHLLQTMAGETDEVPPVHGVLTPGSGAARRADPRRHF